jgi:hypothetical protein
MKMIILVPKVVQGYINRFPETLNNAYRYFNYDRRVYEERVPRGDVASQYKGPDEFSDVDYNGLVGHAKTLVNPILLKYSQKVAYEDALHQAIKSYGNGVFDNKVNAGRYAVLLQSMMGAVEPACPCMSQEPNKYSKKKEDSDEGVVLKPSQVKNLGLKPKAIPTKERARLRKGPTIYKEKGKIHVKAADGKPNEYLTEFLNMVNSLPTKDMDLVRKLVGRWSQSKALIKEFLSSCVKDSGLDKDYVKQVSEDVKKAVEQLNKLEDIYKTVNDFDMDEIKTHIEPLQELINKASQGATEPEGEDLPPPEEAAPAEEPAPEESSPVDEIPPEETENAPTEKESAMLKNAKEFTERLDKIAEEVEQISPEAALQIDMISDVIEGKREASTLKFDADEARFMKNRFNFDVRKREADEPYMDEYKASDFEQVSRIRKSPEPIKKSASLPYQKVSE